jgi:predicted nucleic-acid-binding protein
MNAVDTSITVRAIVRDTVAEAEMALSVLKEGALIPLTVLMETVWVLESFYGLPRANISTALEAVIDMPNVVVSHEESVRWAIARYASKGDFGDLINIAAATGENAIITFDRNMMRHSKPDSPVPVQYLKS